MAGGLFDPEGGGDPTLTGVESRTLRALLQLERRHIAILAEAAGEPDTGTDRVVQWERSKGRGYPAALVVMLRDIEAAVSEFGHGLATQADETDEGTLTIRRPRTAGDIAAALRLSAVGLDFTPDQLKALDDAGGDFWQRLADAATAGAATRLGLSDSRDVHVAYAGPTEQ